ncbi:hypothetical protein G6M84_17775 [Agrobacterium tumefaciens]|uniref:hypothetical protein n=1 Tax=Agrobacterium tumefaciens TaxID=358 RepID=UPI0015740CE7|nr:hypothetical protein [Agrobacterium tumefaciens]NTB98328.1 hypothetical protein [Agrobacterium tumefaciens]NTC45697.1 hypothetical protein [Agrobacterium tumefaciens]
MSDLPAWIQVMQALSTPAIALGGGVIAYRQWRTAQRKLVLDLFERRLTAYNKIVAACRPIFREGGIKDTMDFIALANTIEDARFLFGEDVRSVLRSVREDAAAIATADAVIADGDERDRQQWIDTKFKSLKSLSQAFESLPMTFEPYMALPEKRPRTIREWLDGRNRIRLSYADEKQK